MVPSVRSISLLTVIFNLGEFFSTPYVQRVLYLPLLPSCIGGLIYGSAPKLELGLNARCGRPCCYREVPARKRYGVGEILFFLQEVADGFIQLLVIFVK